MARTDGDTWDLASSVGATATGVAASRALATKQPIPLINDPYADALVKAVDLDSRLATEHMDIQGSTEEWTEKLSERSRRMGLSIDLAEFCTGVRNTAGEYLTSKGWDVAIRSARKAYALNGFKFPENELTVLAGDSGYLSAILT